MKSGTTKFVTKINWIIPIKALFSPLSVKLFGTKKFTFEHNYTFENENRMAVSMLTAES